MWERKSEFLICSPSIRESINYVEIMFDWKSGFWKIGFACMK